MLYAVCFEDDPDRADRRAAHMPEHLTFLERHGATILAAGPLKDAVDGAPAGGLWLVEAASRDAVRALVEADPLWPTGLRRSVRILEWTRVFSEGARRI